MPIYTYRCSSCGTQFERHQFFDDAPLKTCPKCKKKALKKVITPTKVIFKGSGFYVTDNKSASGSKSPSGSKASSSEKSSPAEKSDDKLATEAKPEKKSKSKAESKSSDKSE
ncbi:MAG: zinc ribbon domain-containing protein [Anaerolineales bacterium]|nr:zinc ribbon domain-containing protein [Anaerolineales bacterium]